MIRVVGAVARPPAARRGVDELGHAEVGEQRGVGAARPEGALHVEEYVLRLDVPVDDPGRVGGGEGVGDVGDDGHGRLGGEPPLAVEARAQVRAADEVHDEGEVVAVDDEVADGHDVGVLQPEQRTALLDEASDQFLVGGEVLAQQFDGDGPVGPLAEPHRARAAAPQDLVRGVPAADLPCHDCSLSGWSTRQSYAAEWGLKAPDRGDLHFCGRNHVLDVDKSTKSALREPFGRTSAGPQGLSAGLRACHRRRSPSPRSR